MEAWIDVYHAVTRLTADDTVVFLTDNAIGTDEEENLTHLLRNLGPDARPERIVPFLTLKHSLAYCESYARRLQERRFPALVVLGGDRQDGVPRCLPHASDLRERLRTSRPGLLLGGWANPYRNPREQIDYLAEARGGIDFVLTQVLSHHELEPVARFVEFWNESGIDLPLFGGVFYYRSARAATLRALAEFIPVPDEGLRGDFLERKLSPEEVAATTLRALSAVGIRRSYLSNLPTGSAARRLMTIRRLAGLSS